MQGFKHFELYLRGKEELLVRVLNSGNNAIADGGQGKSNFQLMISQRMRKVLFDDSSSGIVPASPCDREIEKDTRKTAFLVAGYARYERPYVWLRSNHTHFLNILALSSGETALRRDDPLKLESVRAWKTNDQVKVWSIIAEIVQLAFSPLPPKNPFAIDHQYFNELNLAVSLVETGAMIHFLRKVLATERTAPYREQGTLVTR